MARTLNIGMNRHKDHLPAWERGLWPAKPLNGRNQWVSQGAGSAGLDLPCVRHYLT